MVITSITVIIVLCGSSLQLCVAPHSPHCSFVWLLTLLTAASFPRLGTHPALVAGLAVHGRIHTPACPAAARHHRTPHLQPLKEAHRL
jgi:hypothetical protein